jgi:hypothetical protein
VHSGQRLESEELTCKAPSYKVVEIQMATNIGTTIIKVIGLIDALYRANYIGGVVV